MPAATYTRPDYTTQSGTQYPANIDAMAKVFERLAGAFASHQQNAGSPAPDLTVVVDAGAIFDGTTLIEVTQQTVSGFTIPSAGQSRIDRVVLDPSNGQASRVNGTAVTTAPSAPAIPAGKAPLCRLLITSSNTAITNDMITDERVSEASAVTVSGTQTLTNKTLTNPTISGPVMSGPDVTRSVKLQ